MSSITLIDARNTVNLPETENLGLESIALFLRKNAISVTSITMNSTVLTDTILAENGYECDIFGIALFHNNAEYVYTLAQNIKKVKSESIIVVGSRFATENARMILNECPYIDYVVSGDGEYPMLAIAQAYPDRTAMDSLANVFSRVEVSVVSPSRYTPVDKEILDHDFAINAQGRPSAVARIYSKRGCACNCTFCLVPSPSQKNLKKYTSRSVEDLFDEVKWLHERHGFLAFMLHDCPFDDAGKLGIKKLDDFCELLGGFSPKLAFQCMINGRMFVDETDRRIIKMRNAGFTHVMFLLGSGNSYDEKIIKNQSKLIDKERAIDLFKKNDIDCVFEFFCFNPFSTYDSWKENVLFLIRRKCFQLSYYLSKVPLYTGTALYRRCLEENALNANYSYRNVESYTFKNAVIERVNIAILDELRKSPIVSDDLSFQNTIFLFNWLRGVFPESANSLADEIAAYRLELFSTIGDFFRTLTEKVVDGDYRKQTEDFIEDLAAIYARTKSLPLKIMRKPDIRNYLFRK